MNLATRSILGFLNLALIMSLALFLPADTIHYTQAWWYLLIFFGGVVFITVYIFINDKRLLQSRLKVGTAAEERKVQKWVQGVATVGFLSMYIIAGFDYRFHWSTQSKALVSISDAVLVLIMLFFFIVFKKNSYLSATVEVQQGQRVIEDGPYALVRHPMYTAALLLFIFSPLSLGSYWALLMLPLMLLVLIIRCLDEEKALKEKLPAYKDYCRKVKYRLIPFVF